MAKDGPDHVPPHAETAERVLAVQGVRAASGLSRAEAAERLNRVGPNRLEARAPAQILPLLLHQLKGPVVALLAVAALLAAAFGEAEEALAILLVLLVNTAIGFATEHRAARSIEALRALETSHARVRRDGREMLVPAEDLVPGDIVVLEAGDLVPADLRIVEGYGLQANESTLTGEALAVSKTAAPQPVAARLGDRRSMLYKGTGITTGTALGVVTQTGLATELGQVSQLVATAGQGGSPIERKLSELSWLLVWVTLGLAAAITVVGVASGKDPFLMAEAGIALAVAAIPEGLPIVATLTLARGMWRMARRNALVERLSAVETLGATTLILTDKTGTLTENRMTASQLWLPSGKVVVADGDPVAPSHDGAEVAALMEVAVLCNDAVLTAPEEEGTGDPMELALLRLGLRLGLNRAAVLAPAPQVGKRAFDSLHKMMVTIHARHDGAFFAVKGAPEAVLAACTALPVEGRARPMMATDRAEWLARVEALAHVGLRVLAFASKTGQRADAPPYEGLTFLGLIGLEDPTRSDVPEAIEACHRAGIRVVMVTGDHAVTARSIGRAVGLRHAPEHVAQGADIAQLLDSDGIDHIGIFARVSPREKLDLVRAFQATGEIVAMTGDGVNDAPALRQADIGVAMGLRGTDVAREAAAMILLDDAFPTIVAAIREGRIIFGNIRRFVSYLLACNLAEILVVGIAVLVSLPLPVLPLQILYLNLLTDVFPAFALALGEGERDVLNRPPRDPRRPMLGRREWLRIVVQGALIAAATLGGMVYTSRGLGLPPQAAVTVAFLTLAFAQLWQVFCMRADPRRPVVNEITRNPWIWAALALCSLLLVAPPHVAPMAGLLGLVAPDATMWAVILCGSAAPAILVLTLGLLQPRRRG